MAEEKKDPEEKEEWFSPTSWSGIHAIQSGAANAEEALEHLCNTYWYPLYVYIRRTGRSPQDAEDLTQGFFQELLERNLLGGVDRSKGKFRSFLLASLKYYLENERRFRSAQKRGGDRTIVSLDSAKAEERYSQEPASDLTPERIFERRWAITLLEQVQEQLRQEYEANGKLELYQHLKGFLSEQTGLHDYNDVAEKLQMKVNSVAVAVHRLRQRYRELVQAEIARTVADPTEIRSEIQHFYTTLGG